MSIRKMIALHPNVQGRVNQPLGDAVHHAMYCAKMCLSCADACAAECDRHDHEHCKLCAIMCRECAEDCRNAALSVMEPA